MIGQAAMPRSAARRLALGRADWIAGALLAALVGLVRVGWNVAHPLDVFLDSFTSVNLLDALAKGAEPLPRAALTREYPLAYWPFVPLASLVGALSVVRVAMPLVASLAAIPALALVRGGPAPWLGALALLALPDAILKAQTGTPQGLAEPLVLLALLLGLQGRRTAFLLVGAATVLTHHLSSLVVLVLYYAIWIFPAVGSPGWLRGQWPALVFLAAWPVYWTRAFCAAGDPHLASLFVGLAVAGGLPLAALLAFLAAPLASRLEWAGRVLRAASARRGAWLVAGILLAGLAAGGVLATGLRTPGLSGAPGLAALLAAAYAALAVALAAVLLMRGDHRLTLFAGLVALLAGIVWLYRLQPYFDGVRLLDYVLLAGLLAALMPSGVGAAPRADGPTARRLAAGLALVVVILGILRFADAYPRLFAYTAGDWQAAAWLARNAAPRATVATDARLSAIVTGVGGHDATFEGSAWLFAEGSVAGRVLALNGSDRFRDRPIAYVLLDDRMAAQGADVGWFRAALPLPRDLPARLDRIGDRVFEGGGATVWRLGIPPGTAEPAAPEFAPVPFERIAAWFRPLTGLVCR